MKRVFAHIGFSFALTMLLLNLISAKYVLYVLGGLAVLLIASLLIRKYRQALAVPVCLGAAVFACLIFSVTYNSVVLPEQTLNNKTAQCEFYITDLPQQKEDGRYTYTVKTKSVELNGAPQNIKLLLRTKEPLNANSYQLIRGKLNFYQIGSNAFASYGYWSKDIYLSSTLNGYKLTGETVKSTMTYIVKARQGIKKRLKRIPGDEGALSIALITGDKSGISDKLYNDFKFSGTSHLMAVSGLHLTAICGFVLFILKKLKVKNKIAFGATIAVITYYAALCGFSKSIVRAGIMMTVLMLGNIFNRHSDALNSLGIATFIICINPFAVCDIGAILSILSVLALCTSYPILNLKIQSIKPFKTYKVNRALNYVLQAIAAAFCIMAYNLPVAYLFFGYTTVVSLFSSLVLIPLGSAATIIAMLTNFAIRFKIGFPFIILSKLINKIIILLVGWFASIRILIINFEDSFGFVLTGVLIIFAFCFIINKKLLKKAAALSFIIICVSLTATAFGNNFGSYAYITENGAIAIINKETALVFGADSKSDYYSVKRFLSSREKDIDCLFIEKDNYYSNKLAQDFHCDSIKHKTYEKSFSDDLSVNFTTKKDLYNFTANINGVTVSDNNTASFSENINIFNSICVDDNGVIDLSNGDIIYRITDKNYSVRRVSIWQE